MTEQAPLLFGFLSSEALAVLVSVGAALLVGWLTVRTQRHIAGARLAFETINKNNWDRDYIEKRVEFLKIRDSKEGMAHLAHFELSDNSGDEKAKAASTVRAILNNYENLAIGIRRGILDEEYLFRYMRSQVVRDWEKSSAYVIALRTHYEIPQLFVEFEGLATQWQNNMSYYKQDKLLPARKRVVTVR